MDLELNTITSGLKGNIGFDMKPMHDGSWITKVNAEEWVWEVDLAIMCVEVMLRLWLQMEFLR